MIKATGAEWKRFYSDKTAWPDGAWHDDEEITVDGLSASEHDVDLSNVDDGASLTVEGGIVFLSGDHTHGPSVEAHFKKWRKAQAIDFFVVECPKDRLSEVKAAIKAAGGKAA